MHKKLFFLFIICSLFLFTAACGPSSEKVAEAREKYTQLAEMHNQTVEAYKKVADDSLNESLDELRQQVVEVGNYDLTELKDEEIDLLIQIMDSLIGSYEQYLAALSDIKEKEEAAVLVEIPVTVTNHTDFTFALLKLYEKGNYDTHPNVLENMEALAPGQALMGLVVSRDVDNTPWMLVLENTDGVKYELELSVKEYDEEGITLGLFYGAEEEKLFIE